MAYGINLTVDDISRKLNVNKQSVCKWIRDGKMKGHLKTPGNRREGYVVRMSEFREFLNENDKYKSRLAKKNESDIYRSVVKKILEMEKKALEEHARGEHSNEYTEGYRKALKELYNRFDKLYLEMV